MISPRMQDALNEQIRNEFYSSFAYLSMSAHFEHQNLPGFALWMRVQAGEEHVHAMKIFDHVLDRGGEVKMPAIAQPPVKFERTCHRLRAGAAAGARRDQEHP